MVEKLNKIEEQKTNIEKLNITEEN